MAKERNLVRKKCPHCKRMISKSGWNMHMIACSSKHDEEIVKWENVEATEEGKSGDEQSFRGEGSGEGKGEGTGEKEFWEETFGE